MFFPLLEVTEAHISVCVFIFALLVVEFLSYHTKCSYLSISVYQALNNLYMLITTGKSDDWKMSTRERKR